LYRACAIDIKYSCKDIPFGESRHLSCLLEELQESPTRLKSECREALQHRMALWQSVKAHPESVREVVEGVSQSSSRTYLLAVIFISVIFITGLFCSRVMKRVSRLAKVARGEEMIQHILPVSKSSTSAAQTQCIVTAD